MTVQVVHTLTFTASSPLAVGGASIRADADLGVAVDGLGRFIIPGSSLAGVLRARARQLFSASEPVNRESTARTNETSSPENAIDRLFGGDPTDPKSAASRVTVDDAIVTLPAGAQAMVRAGVGIDRITGAAAPTVLHDRVVLPAGSRLTVTLTTDSAGSDSSDDLDDVHALLADLRDRGLRVGASTTRGLGKLTLDDATEQVRDLTTALGLLAILNGDAKPGESDTSEGAFALKDLSAREATGSVLDVTITWHPVGPLMVKSARDGQAADHLPHAEPWAGCWRLVIPGSSVKGAFRSSAERIVRTVLNIDVPTAFAQQLTVPLVEDLFGTPPTGNTDDGSSGAVWFDDVTASETLTSELVQALGAATSDQELLGAMKTGKRPQWTNGYHVAIDRWTGGAAKGRLYSGIEPWGEAWNPVGLTVDLDRLHQRIEHRRQVAAKGAKAIGADAAVKTAQGPTPCSVEEEAGAAVQLLMLVFREFAGGRIPLGFGTNRGYGSVEVETVELAGAATRTVTDGTEPMDEEPSPWPVAAEGWAGVPGAAWSTGWQKWLAAKNAEHPNTAERSTPDAEART